MPFRCPRVVPGAVFAVSAMLFCGVGTTGSPAAEVRVQSSVPAVARVAGPGSITLEPGESREVTVRIAANFRWRLSIGLPNPAIAAADLRLEGAPGGCDRAGNTFKVLFRCDPGAAGRQSGNIEYFVERR